MKAQIKLKFPSALKKPAMCERSFSLTQKANKREYKAFESALSTLDEHNTKKCFSYKCAHAPPAGRRTAAVPGAPSLALPAPHLSCPLLLHRLADLASARRPSRAAGART